MIIITSLYELFVYYFIQSTLYYKVYIKNALFFLLFTEAVV